MNPSSSTETESGPQPTLVRRNVPRRGLRESFPQREPPLYDTVYEDTEHDYEKDLPEPSRLDQLIALITLGKVFNQKTVYIAKPATNSEEAGARSAWCHQYISALVTNLTTSIMFWFTAVFALLLGGINGILGVTERATEIKRNRAERRARKKMLVKFNQDFRNMFPVGNVLFVARNTMCFQMDKRILLERAPNLLQGAEITFMLLPYLRKVHLVRLNRSAQKVENFLRYLTCEPDSRKWWTYSPKPTKFDIAGLYCMAREYESSESYDERFVRFSRIGRWMDNNPIEVFATACRAINIDYRTAEAAILTFCKPFMLVEAGQLSPQAWTEPLIHEISVASMISRQLTANMHGPYLSAYADAYNDVCRTMDRFQQRWGEQIRLMNPEHILATAVILLADAFLGRAGGHGCCLISPTTVQEARRALTDYGEDVLRDLRSMPTIANNPRHSPDGFHLFDESEAISGFVPSPTGPNRPNRPDE